MARKTGNDAERTPMDALTQWLVQPFQEFLETEASGGIMLIAATVAALAWANSPWAGSYDHFWHTYAGLAFGDFQLKLSLVHWINDGFMALFFFWVGLEIKRELLTGELSSPRKAALPMMAALGGMAVPALIYVGFNSGGEGLRGWGIPMATDIAFAVGILMLLGKRVPLGVKVFLTALAVVDDLGAVVVIAVFYTSGLQIAMLLAGLGLLLLLAVLARLGARHPAVYAVFGLVVWYLFLKSGVHATVAGVLTAMTVPHKVRFGNSPLAHWEHALAPVVAYVVMPVFALANAGVSLGGLGGGLAEAVPLGIILGLFVGKPVGIFFFSWIAVKVGMGALPENVGWRAILGAGCLGGIGFTMSLFIAALAFGLDAGALLDSAKAGILTGSLLSAIVGTLILMGGRATRSTA